MTLFPTSSSLLAPIQFFTSSCVGAHSLVIDWFSHLIRCGWISQQFESPTSMVGSWGWQDNGWWSLVMTLVWFWSCYGLVLVLFWSCYVSFYFRSVISVDLIWATCFSTCFSVVASWAVFFMFFVFLLAPLGFCLMSWFVLVSSLFTLSSSCIFVWGFLFRFVNFPLIHWPVPDLIWVVLLLVVVACFPVCRLFYLFDKVAYFCLKFLDFLSVFLFGFCSPLGSAFGGFVFQLFLECFVLPL